MSTHLPETYNDDRIDRISRRVYHKALEHIEKMLDKEDGVIFSAEKLSAYAEVAASCKLKDDDEDDDG
jgi:hypothetical protein